MQPAGVAKNPREHENRTPLKRLSLSIPNIYVWPCSGNLFAKAFIIIYFQDVETCDSNHSGLAGEQLI
jgi:hypothetical protein